MSIIFNYAKFSFNSPIGKLLRLPLKLIPQNTILPILCGPGKGKKWIKGSSVNGCWLGTYEYEKQLIFSKTIKKGMIIFDVGANVGFYSLLASSLTGDSGKVISFEPLPENIVFLHKHKKLNQLNNIIIVDEAVTNEISTLGFSLSHDRSMGFIAEGGEIKVKTTTLDEFCSKNILIPDIIKIDIEGSEFEALKGSLKILQSKKPIIFLATHSEKIRVECLALLISLSYTINAIDGQNVEQSNEFLCV